MAGWMCTLVVLEQVDRNYSYSLLKILFILGQYPVNLDIPTPKISTHHMDPKSHNGDFLENNSILVISIFHNIFMSFLFLSKPDNSMLVYSMKLRFLAAGSSNYIYVN